MFFREDEEAAQDLKPPVLTQEELDVVARVQARHKMDSTSYGRFYQRLAGFKHDGKPYPVARHYGFWLIHNCIVHPLMAISPQPFLLELHELSSRWLNKRTSSAPLAAANPPRIQSRFFWTFHNYVGHMAIGLLPIKPCFAFHDWSATKMGVPDWV